MSEQKTWQVGDVVRLKSGGPAMTVAATPGPRGENGVICTWFCQTEVRVKQHTFQPNTLECAAVTDGRVQQMATDKQLEMLAKYGMPGAVATLLTRKQAAEALNYFTRQRAQEVPVANNADALKTAFGAIPDEPVSVPLVANTSEHPEHTLAQVREWCQDFFDKQQRNDFMNQPATANQVAALEHAGMHPDAAKKANRVQAAEWLLEYYRYLPLRRDRAASNLAL